MASLPWRMPEIVTPRPAVVHTTTITSRSAAGSDNSTAEPRKWTHAASGPPEPSKKWHPIAPRMRAKNRTATGSEPITNKPPPRCWLCMLALGLGLLLPQPAFAQKPGTSSATAPSAKPRHRMALPSLPAVPRVSAKTASSRASNELSSRLSQLTALRVKEPLEKVDLAFLNKDINPELVPAIATELRRLKKRVDSKRARSILRRARSHGRKALRKLKRAAKRDATVEIPEGDWLVFILALPEIDESKDSLAQIYAMLRMLEAVGDTQAVRQMVHAYSAFGELVRIDLQRAFVRLNTRAVAALIEAKQHDARKVRRWARRQLDDLGRAIPGEAVATRDPIVLADVLLAFGRIKELDATRVILSYIGNERARLRTAARQAIVALGEASAWYLKEAYQTQTGKKAPRAWNWKRSAQELFRLHDEARLAVVYANVDRGTQALSTTDYANAVAAFDKVLTRLPLFDGRRAMAPAYAGYGLQLLKEGKELPARAAFEKALRLAPNLPSKDKVRSRIFYLEGKELAAKQTPDRFIVERAIKLDPENQLARQLLDQLDQARHERTDKRVQQLAAAVAGLMLLLSAICWLLYRRYKRNKPTGSLAQTTTTSAANAAPGAARLGDASEPPAVGKPPSPSEEPSGALNHEAVAAPATPAGATATPGDPDQKPDSGDTQR